MAGEWWLPHHCRVAEWSTTYLPQYKSYVICHRGSLASGQMTRARGNKERVNSCAPLLIPGWMQMHLRCNSLRIYRLLSSKMMVFWRALHWKPHRNTSISILLVARSEELNSDPLFVKLFWCTQIWDNTVPPHHRRRICEHDSHKQASIELGISIAALGGATSGPIGRVLAIWTDSTEHRTWKGVRFLSRKVLKCTWEYQWMCFSKLLQQNKK